MVSRVGYGGRQMTTDWLAAHAWPVVVFLGGGSILLVSRVDRAVGTTWSTCAGHLPGGAGKGVSAPHCIVSLKFHCHNLIYGHFYLKIKVSFLSSSFDF